MRDLKMPGSVPKSIRSQLAKLRRKELSLRLVWGAARWIALAAAVLAASCLLDWLIDRRTDTPTALRVLLLAGQVCLWAFAFSSLIFRPLTTRQADTDLALWVEEHVPEFDHRLITAVQLNQPNAPTSGMSADLIDATTRQAQERTERSDFAGLLDAGRARRAAGVLAPTLGLAALLFALNPGLAMVLIGRQFLADLEIPRSTHLEADADHRFAPAGEEVALRFRVRGDYVPDSAEGTVLISAEDRGSESWPLKFESTDRKSGESIFSAVVPGGQSRSDYRAWLLDGRTRRPASVTFVPRPVVKAIQATVLLPSYVGERPAGGRYEQIQPRGDVAGPVGSAARIVAEIQKPVVKAHLELLARSADPAAGETVLRTAPMALSADALSVSGEFDVVRGLTGYRIIVEDKHGFANSTPPRRGVGLVPDEPPRVVLLAERFADPGEVLTAEESDLEGMPIPLGSTARLAYYANHPYGLSKAQIAYRHITKDGVEGPWLKLPMVEVRRSAVSGPFDVRRGAFAASLPREQIGFHAVPSPDPTRTPHGLEGGGRYDFQTKAVPGLKVGDSIDFFVEVFDRNPEVGREPGRSEVRRKQIIDPSQFAEWVSQTLQEETRLRKLEQQQRTIFFREPGTAPDERTPIGPTTVSNPPRTKTEPKEAKPVTGTVIGGEHRFVRNWLVIGVFPNKDEKGRDTAFSPEVKKIEVGADKRYEGAVAGTVRWKPLNSETDKIDLQKNFNAAFSDSGVAYAACWVHSAKKQPAGLLTGADDSIKVWINRKQVIDGPGPREAEPGTDSALIDLNEGWNEVLVKVDNRFGRWAFYFEFRAPEGGKPLEGIKVSTEPPK